MTPPHSNRTRRPRPPSDGPSALFRKLLTRQRDPDLDVLSKRILLPSLPVADEDMSRIGLWEEGRALARQERWEDISERIRSADAARKSTPAGQSEAILLAMGAHADVVGAAIEALRDDVRPDTSGIAALEDVLEDAPDDHALAMVVAYAHVRIARAWQDESAMPCAETIEAHLTAARDSLAPFDATELQAPSLAAVLCAHEECVADDLADVLAAYERVIALDPESPCFLRGYGMLLCDAPANLEQAAQRMAERTQDTWQEGGYTWVYLDALKATRAPLGTVDSARFIQGMRDIVALRPDQHIINELAAFCALSMQPSTPLPAQAAVARGHLHRCLDWIYAQHLHELHPRLWAGVDLAETEFPSKKGYRVMVTEGRKRALRAIAAFFADQMQDGSSIAFSPAGMYRLPAI